MTNFSVGIGVPVLACDIHIQMPNKVAMEIIRKIRSALFRTESLIHKYLFSCFNFRPSSAPYISGDTFRSIAKYRFETDTKNVLVENKNIRNNIVFCESNRLNDFFNGPSCLIRFPYVLISTNGDTNIGNEWLSKLPKNLITWFAQNLNTRHPRIRPLPIGLENKALYWHGVTSDFETIRNHLKTKRSRILYGFTVGTNLVERGPALEVLSKIPIAESLARVNSREYRRILAQYKFVASPPGNGLDCHRTWEALYLGVIPIVRRSVASEEFARFLPIWVVDDYRELEGITELDLSNQYDTLWSSAWRKDALWFEYWKNEIIVASRSNDDDLGALKTAANGGGNFMDDN